MEGLISCLFLYPIIYAMDENSKDAFKTNHLMVGKENKA